MFIRGDAKSGLIVGVKMNANVTNVKECGKYAKKPFKQMQKRRKAKAKLCALWLLVFS